MARRTPSAGWRSKLVCEVLGQAMPVWASVNQTKLKQTGYCLKLDGLSSLCFAFDVRCF